MSLPTTCSVTGKSAPAFTPFGAASPEGVRFMNCQGQWKYFAWAEITWAERTSALGVPFLDFRIAGPKGQEEQEGVLLLLDDLEGLLSGGGPGEVP